MNCEEAEAIGAQIHKTLDNVNLTDAKIKKKDQLCSLYILTKSVQVSEKSQVYVSPTVLFTRLAAIAQREDVEQYFAFELTNQPQALFKDGLMRKPDKSSLRKVLLPDEMKIPASRLHGKYVLDGGALLHRVHWAKGTKFGEIAQVYVKNYVRQTYGSAFVIFDGYSTELSTKSHEHMRRTGSKGSSMNVMIKDDNEVPYNKERFLSNTM